MRNTLSKHGRKMAAVAAVTALMGAGIGSAPASAAPETLPVTALEWAGESGGMFGTAASRSSCDVNGDGTADTVIGDWGWDRPGASNVGAAYVLTGRAALDGGEVGDPTDSGAIRIDGPSSPSSALVGWSVSCLGDVNGDGFDDLALGSGSRTYHRVHIVLGNRDFANVDLDFLGAGGFVIEDPGASDAATGDNDNFGIAIGEVGDVNGDGLADIGIVDQLADNNGRTNSGRVWIIAGSESVRDVDLSDPVQRENRVLRTIDGAQPDERLGTVASAGDVNGDGIDDFSVSSYTATPWGPEVAVAGSAHVVFGDKDSGAVDLAAPGDHGFAVYGPMRQRDRLGISLAPAGDINGDGKADLIIGADGVSNAQTGSRNGGAAVIFGSTSTATVMTSPGARGYSVFACDDSELDTTCDSSHKVSRGYWINGPASNEKIGFSVASLPDVNGDGTPEIVLGGQNRSTWLVFGDKTRTRTLELADAGPETALKLGSGFGYAVGNAGDLDGNGTADVVSGGGNKATVFLLGALNTSTTLTAPERETFGQTIVLSAATTALVPAVGGTHEGTITFTANGMGIAGCKSLEVRGNLPVDCTTTVGWPAGAADIEAAFTSSGRGFAASSATRELAVDKRATQVTEVVLNKTSTNHGAGGVKATATVPGITTGRIEFLSARRVLGTSAVDAAGAATLLLPRDLAVGEHTVVARFLGTESLKVSAKTAAEETLLVFKSQTSVSAPALTSASGVYGKPGSVTAVVTGAKGGTVEFRSGSRVLGKVPVGASGAAKLSLPAMLAPGKYNISARYLGSTTAASSAVSPASRTLTVAKARLLGVTKVSGAPVKKHSKPTVTVRLGKLNNGSYPVGHVRLASGSWTKTQTLRASDKGTIKVLVGKSFSKPTKVTAKYLGNDTTAAGRVAGTIVKIAKR